MKRLIALTLSAFMLTAVFAACGQRKESSSAGSVLSDSDSKVSSSVSTDNDGKEDPSGETPQSFDEDPYELTVCYAVAGEAQPDLPMIQEKLNEITLAEINTRVTLEPVNLFSMANTYALKASSQEKMDLMVLFPGNRYMGSFANNNLIIPLDEYLEKDGQTIIEVMGDMLPVGQFKGIQYAIPQNRNIRTSGSGFGFVMSFCEKYDINIKDMKTIDDVEASFAMIKENEPEIVVVAPESVGSTIAGVLAPQYDNLGSYVGALSVEDDGTLKVINYFETEDYMNSAKKAREWFELGYISRDVLTSQEAGSEMNLAEKSFCNTISSVDQSVVGDATEMVMLESGKPLLTTADDQQVMWAIPVTAEDPEQSMKFLNLCFESADIANLMMYGVEGIHHRALEDGIIDMEDEDGNPMYNSWANWWYMFGDYNKLKIRADMIEKVSSTNSVEEFLEVTENWAYDISPAYGFTFDPDPVANEIAACDDVYNEFVAAIGNGTVDPESEIPKFNERLYSAGLQTIIDEKQVQLDAWLETQ